MPHLNLWRGNCFHLDPVVKGQLNDSGKSHFDATYTLHTAVEDYLSTDSTIHKVDAICVDKFKGDNIKEYHTRSHTEKVSKSSNFFKKLTYCTIIFPIFAYLIRTVLRFSLLHKVEEDNLTPNDQLEQDISKFIQNNPSYNEFSDFLCLRLQSDDLRFISTKKKEIIFNLVKGPKLEAEFKKEYAHAYYYVNDTFEEPDTTLEKPKTIKVKTRQAKEKISDLIALSEGKTDDLKSDYYRNVRKLQCNVIKLTDTKIIVEDPDILSNLLKETLPTKKDNEVYVLEAISGDALQVRTVHENIGKMTTTLKELVELKKEGKYHFTLTPGDITGKMNEEGLRYIPTDPPIEIPEEERKKDYTIKRQGYRNGLLKNAVNKPGTMGLHQMQYLAEQEEIFRLRESALELFKGDQHLTEVINECFKLGKMVPKKVEIEVNQKMQEVEIQVFEGTTLEEALYLFEKYATTST